MRKRSGFTVIELMIVIAIVAILSAIAVPNYITYQENQQVSNAARAIYSSLQSAKMTAINENTAVSVLFTPGTGSSGTYQVFSDRNDDGVNDADEETISGQMMPGAVLQTAAFAGVANSTRFTPLGLTTGENGTVTVTNTNGSRTSLIVVNTVGGIRID